MRKGGGIDPEVRVALDRLILRRVRVGLGFGLATVVSYAIANHLFWTQVPRWSHLFNLIMTVLIGIGFLLTKLPIVARHPAVFCLLIFSIGCVARALAGIWHGGVVITALMLLALPLITAGMIPWGLFPQVAMVGVAGTAIGVNALLVDQGFAAPPGQAAVTIVLGLLASVVLAIEVQRHRVQTLIENVGRRRAEERLARLNAELERRVAERTQELALTAARLTTEARERQLASQELRDSERRLQDILDHAPAHIQLKDTEGRYVLVNRHWEESVERRRADVIGRTAHEVFSPHIADLFRAGDRQVLAQRQSLQFENSLKVRGVLTTYVTVKFPVLDAEGNVLGVCGISTDITHRRQAEEMARAHQAELAHVLRVSTLGEMAAGLAHEINQPLGAIANYAQGSVRRLREGAIGAPELLPIIEAIAHEALRAGEIIRRLRELLRKEEPERTSADLNELAGESARFVEGETRELDIAMHLDFASRLPPVHCNSVQIEQVILNLLLNAVDAVQGADNGNRRVALSTGVAGADRVEVAVSDSGPGLPDADVFAPFYTTKRGGLGMGLAISRSIIEAHGGRLEAASNPGGGSTFRFTLPVTDPQNEPGEEVRA
jgi:PAS domain S-box-containing protein